MKLRTLALFFALLILAPNLWAGDEGVQEPMGSDETLVFMSVEVPRFLDLNQGPNQAWIIKTYPYISTRRTMGRDSNLVYMGNLKVGNTYRVFDFLNEYDAGRYHYIIHYPNGFQGNDNYTVDVQKPGLLYLGDFKLVNDNFVYLGKTQELAMLEKLKGNLMFRPTWKTLVENRIKELKK